MTFLSKPVAALILGGMLGGLSGAAHAQANYEQRCGRVNGIYTCKSTLETARSTTTTVCGSYRGSTACTSDTEDKAPAYNARTEVLTERPKIAAEIHHNDPGATSLCPPPHKMTAHDGCQ